MLTPANETTCPADKVFSALAAEIMAAPAAGEQSAIMDSTEYTREAIRKCAIERYRATCPPAYLDTNWQHPDLVPWGEQIDKVKGWKNGPRGLIASGPSGRGKTRALWELYRRLSCEDVVDVRFYYAGDWFNTLQLQVSYGRDEAQGWVEAVAARPVVILDDFGQEAILANRTEWASGWFFRFLDLRVGRRLPVIISTNLRAVAFAATAGKGDPLMRRLLEVCEPVKFYQPGEGSPA